MTDATIGQSFSKNQGPSTVFKNPSVLIGYRHYRAVITRYKFAIFVGRKSLFYPANFLKDISGEGRWGEKEVLGRDAVRDLAAGASIKGTARKFAIDHHALRRHWTNHVSARKGRVSNDAMPASEKPTTRGWPLGIGFQEQVSNHSKLLR